MPKIIINLFILFLLTNCMAPANEKLAKQFSKSSKADSGKLLTYLGKIDDDKITDIQGTFLRKAIDLENIEVMEKLLQQKNIDINGKADDSLTPLGYLISKNYEDQKLQHKMAKLLIDNAADIDAVNISQQTILIQAVIAEIDDIVMLLVDSGAEIEETDNEGKTALHHSKEKSLKILLENGADPKITDNAGNTVLHYLYFIDDIKLALSYELDINLQNEKGDTILLASCNKKKCNNIRIEQLIELGADPNIQNNLGQTILLLAAANISDESINILLENEADASIKDKNDKTALHYLAYNIEKVNFKNHDEGKNFYKIAALLIAEGADPLAIDNSDNNPYDLAAKKIKAKIKDYKADIIREQTLLNSMK